MTLYFFNQENTSSKNFVDIAENKLNIFIIRNIHYENFA